MTFEDLLKTITKRMNGSYVRTLKLARIFACILLLFAWICTHVTNLYAIFLHDDTLHLLRQLVFLNPCRALLHVYMRKVLLLFVILSLGPPIIRPDVTWPILRTIYDFGELGATLYFIAYAINSNLESVSGLGHPDTQIVTIALLYLFVCIFICRYNDNTYLFETVRKKYSFRGRTGYVDVDGKEICDGDTIIINAKLYTVERLPKDSIYYASPKKKNILTNHDRLPLDDVAGKYPIKIFDAGKVRSEK